MADTNGVEVEVRETRPSTTGPRDATAASTVVRGEELETPGASSAEALARVPGVEISRTGSTSDLATAAIRGATSAQTPIYLAGIRLNDDVSGVADLSTVPLFLLDRVEVYRGNAPLDADRLGMGGAIFFEPRFARNDEVGAGGEIGSFGERGLWATGAAASPRASTLVAVRHEWAQNDFPYANDADVVHRRQNADYVATDAWAVSRYEVGGGARVTALVHAFEREQGTPGLAIVENLTARTDAERLLGAVSAHVPCGHAGDGAESCVLDLTTSGLFSSSVLRDPSSVLETAPLVTTAGERVEQTARVTARLGERVTLGAAIDESVDRIAVNQSAALTLDANRVTTRPAVTATWHASSSTDVLGLADVECDRTRSSVTVAGGFCTPEPGARLGVSQRLGESFEIRGNAGRYVRPPTLGELYGVSAVVHGNAALAAETGETADAGVRFRKGAPDFAVEADAYGFLRTADDLVAYRQNVLGVIVPYNVGRARVVGAEVAVNLDAIRVLSDTLSLTVMDPRDTSPSRTLTNDILPFRSRLVVSDYAEAHSRSALSGLSVDRAAIGVRVTHRSSRYADAAGLIVLPAQTTFDVEASASFLRRAFTLRLALRDVFDARQVDTVGLPLPGRSAHASLEAYFR